MGSCDNCVIIGPMISVVVPTLNNEPTLAQCLASLVPAAVDGVVVEVLIADGGSTDSTYRIADEMGARILKSGPRLGERLAEGAEAAKSNWLLFVWPETTLSRGWPIEAAEFMDRAERHKRDVAAVFHYAIDDPDQTARRAERLARIQSGVFGLPFPAQGLLLGREHYKSLGGHKPLDVMAEVDLLRRIGKRSLITLRSEAIINVSHSDQESLDAGSMRQLAMAALSYLNVPTSLLARIAGQRA